MDDPGLYLKSSDGKTVADTSRRKGYRPNLSKYNSDVNGLRRIQFKCSHGVIVAKSPTLTQPISKSQSQSYRMDCPEQWFTVVSSEPSSEPNM